MSRESGGVREYAGRLLVTVLVAIIVPIVATYADKGKVPGIDQVLLGLLTFLLGTVLQIAADLAALRGLQERDVKMWRLDFDAEVRLNNVRGAFKDLVRSSSGLYVSLFARRIEELEREITHAAGTDELPVEQNSDTTGLMLEQMQGHETDIIRFIHFVERNEFLFDVHSRQFFAEVAALVGSGRVMEVRRLMIYADAQDLEDERSQRLVDFHAGTRGFACRAISRTDFDKLMHDAKLPAGTTDFGIYGKRYVYRNLRAEAGDVRGLFSYSEAEVLRFITFFDKCWTSHSSVAPKSSGAAISLGVLFSVDASAGGAGRGKGTT